MRLLSGGVGTEQARGKTPSDTRIYFEVLVNGRGHNLTCRPSCGCRFFCNTDAQLESQGQEIIFWFWDLGCSNKKFKSTDDYDCGTSFFKCPTFICSSCTGSMAVMLSC